MAKTTDSLLIDIGLNADGIIEFFDSLSKKIDFLIKKSADAGDNLDELLGNPIGDQTAAAVESVKNNSDAATSSMRQASQAGQKAGKDIEKGAKQGSQALQKLDSMASKVFSAIKGYAGPLAAMFGAKMMFTNFIDEGDKLDKLSKEVRMNVSELDAWRKANVAAGGSADAFTNALKSFTDRTGASASVFLRMGKQLNGMNDAQANYALKYLGLTRESAAVFLQNNKQMNELVGKYRQMALSPKDAENARRFKIQWEITTMSMKNLGNQVAKVFLPYVDKGMKKFGEFTDFVAQHSEFIKIALELVAGAAAIALGPKSALMLGGKALGLLASPVGLVVAGIVALALALDDLISFAKGGPSAFEDLLRSMGTSDDEIKELRKSFQDAWKAIQDLMDALKPVGDLFLQAFGSVIKVAVETIVLTIGKVAEVIAKVINSVSGLRDKFVGAFESIKSSIQPIVDWISSALSDITNFEMPSWVNPMNWFGSDDKKKAVVAPAGATAGNAGGVVKEKGRTTNINSPISNQTVVNFNGNPDKEQVIQGVNQGVSQAMQGSTDMLNNAASGVEF
jgi:methyl-accepting chemotaxis protein|nr:MAG TPA: tail tape measure [Caudoviricetes sp.]